MSKIDKLIYIISRFRKQLYWLRNNEHLYKIEDFNLLQDYYFKKITQYTYQKNLIEFANE